MSLYQGIGWLVLYRINDAVKPQDMLIRNGLFLKPSGLFPSRAVYYMLAVGQRENVDYLLIASLVAVRTLENPP
jgi:hypothetical protein